MGTGSFPGVKRQGCDVDHPPPSSAEVKEKAELYLYFLLPLCAFMAFSRVNFTLTESTNSISYKISPAVMTASVVLFPQGTSMA
jgi:hypothetical protein